MARQLNRRLKNYLPSITWSSLAIADDIQAAAHVDAANCQHSWNPALAVGDFQGGGLCVADEDGDAEFEAPSGLARFVFRDNGTL